MASADLKSTETPREAPPAVGQSASETPIVSEDTTCSDLSDAELQNVHALIDSLSVLRLSSQAEEQLKVIIGTHRTPLRVLQELCTQLRELGNVYASEAGFSLIAKIIGEMPEPPGQLSTKFKILQSLLASEKSEERVSRAVRSVLETISRQWAAPTLSALSFDYRAYVGRPPPRHAAFRSLHHPQTPTDQFSLGFLPQTLYSQLTAGSPNSYESLREAETLLKAVDLETLRQHFSAILDLFVSLAKEKHVKTKILALEMLYSLLSHKGISLSVDLLPHAEKLLGIVGDVNIHVRQGVFRCLRATLRECRLSKLLPLFAQSLSSSNWHQREEVLKLFTAAMLAIDEVHNIDFLELVQVVAPLMDDETPKVRYVAVETLCVLAHLCGVQRVESELQPLMDDVALSLLKVRFTRKALPMAREETVDFPRDAPLSAPVSTKNSHQFIASPKTPSAHFSFVGLDGSEERSVQPAETVSLLPTERLRNRSLEPPLPRIREVRVVVGSNSTTDLLRGHRKGGRLHATLNSIKPELTLPRNSSLPSLSRNRSKATLPRDSDSTALSSTLSSSTNVLTYLKPEEIQAPEDSSRDLDKVLEGLQSLEWAEQFETLNLIRKLLKFSPEALKSSKFAEVLRQVLLWAESLRSSLSKNALIVLGELSEFVPRSLEPDLEQVLSLLLRKSVDTNLFISEVANRALQQMCASVSDGRLVTCLLANVGTIRSSLVKAKTAYCFELLIGRLKAQFPKIRDFTRVMKTLFEYSQDASVEVRHSAKRAFQHLSKETPQEDIDRYMSRILPTKSYTDYVEGQKTWGEAEEVRPIQQSSAREIPRRDGAVRRLVIRSSRETKIGQDTDPLLEISAGMKGLLWKERYDAVTKATELALQTSHGRAPGLPQAIDSIATGIADSSIKVSYHSINCLKKLATPLQGDLPPYLPTLVTALSRVLSTSNSSLKSLAIEVLAELIGHSDVAHSLPSLSSAYPHISGKGRIGVLKLICELLPSSPSKELISCHAVPVLKSLLANSSPDLEHETKEFVQTLDGLIELSDFLTEAELRLIGKWREASAAYS